MEGDFTIYYDTTKDERYPIWAGKGTLEAAKAIRRTSLTSSVPAVQRSCKYILVFKGKMGNEEAQCRICIQRRWR